MHRLMRVIDMYHEMMYAQLITVLVSLCSDLRGDGVDFIRLLTANVSIEDLQRINTEISGKVTQVRRRRAHIIYC
jgi:hypothetical protein